MFRLIKIRKRIAVILAVALASCSFTSPAAGQEREVNNVVSLSTPCSADDSGDCSLESAKAGLEAQTISIDGVSGNYYDHVAYSGKQAALFPGKDGKYYAVQGTKPFIGDNAFVTDPSVLKGMKNGFFKARKCGETSVISTKYGNFDVVVFKPSISVKRVGLSTGDSFKLELMGVPKGVPVAWASTSQNVIQVLSGNCYAVGIGRSKVTAYVGGKGFSAVLSVHDRAGSTEVFNLEKGRKRPQRIKGIGDIETAEFSVSEGECPVNEGKINFLDARKAPYNVTSSEGHSFRVYMNDSRPEEKKYEIKIGERVRILPDMTHEMLDFKSSNPGVASVSEFGVLTGNAAGKARLTAKAGNKRVKIYVTVTGEICKMRENGDTFSYHVVDDINGNKGFWVSVAKGGTVSVNERLESPKESVSEDTVSDDTVSDNNGSGDDNGGDEDEPVIETAVYTVYHKKEMLDGTFSDAEGEEFTAKVGETVTPDVKYYTGFASPERQSVKVTGDGKAFVEYLYRRNSYAVTVLSGDFIKEVSGNGEYPYEGVVTVSACVPEDYVETSWTYDNGEEEGSGKRFHKTHAFAFDSWSDGITDPVRTVTVSDGNLSLTAFGTETVSEADVQYKVDVQKTNGIVSATGSQWVNEGESINISATSAANFTIVGGTGNTGTVSGPTVVNVKAEPVALKLSSNSAFYLRCGNDPSWTGTILYSNDNGLSWHTWDGSEINGTASEPIFLRGTGNTKITKGGMMNSWLESDSMHCTGNIELLLDYQTVFNGGHPAMGENCFMNLFNGWILLETPPELPSTALTKNCYNSMFENCLALKTAPSLPASALTEGCYAYMFSGCSSLKEAPVLRATVMKESCYKYMFERCSSLKEAPVLRATVMKDFCYSDMFKGCTSLKTAPSLPATSLAEFCYAYMFDGCTALTTLPSLPATTMAERCYEGMFDGCSSLKVSATNTGTCTKAYRLPRSGTGTDMLDEYNDSALYNMFSRTGGSFKGTPALNTTYYVENTPVG